MSNISELSSFLEIKDGNILLPIDKYTFALSPKAAGNMVVALRAALRLLAKRAADGYCSCSNKHEHYEKHDDYEVCLVCGNPRRQSKSSAALGARSRNAKKCF